MAQQDAFTIRETSRDVSSAVAGSICCCYTGQPFDTIKTRVQADKIGAYRGAVDALRQTVSKEGVVALWKGSVPTAAGMRAENAVAFGVSEQIKREISVYGITMYDAKTAPLQSALQTFCVGAVTGCFSALVLIPSEIIKARTQMERQSVSSTAITKKIYRLGGVGGFFAGLDGQLSRDFLFYGAFFGSYDLFCNLMRRAAPVETVPDEAIYFVSGGLAGMFGWVVAMPADVPKTIVQSSWDSKVLGSYFPAMAKILRKRGFLGLYTGVGPSLLRAFPANAALFLGVETMKKQFDKHF